MNFVSAKCPNCNGELQLDESMDTAYCIYCGSQLIVEKAIQLQQIAVEGIATCEKLLQNAEVFLRLGETTRARAIYTRLSDEYPEDYRGWWGLFRMQTDDFTRVADDFKMAEYAIAVAREPQKQELKQAFVAYLSPFIKAAGEQTFPDLDADLQHSREARGQILAAATDTAQKKRLPYTLLAVFGVLIMLAGLVAIPLGILEGGLSGAVMLFGFGCLYHAVRRLMTVDRCLRDALAEAEADYQQAAAEIRDKRLLLQAEYDHKLLHYQTSLERVMSR